MSMRIAYCIMTSVLLLFFLCLPAKAQEPAPGRLYVEANVAEAVISILNQQLTFHQGIKLPPGMYVVQVAAEGFATQTKTVTVLADKDLRLRVTLDAADDEASPTETAAKAKNTDDPWTVSRAKGKNRLFVKTNPDDATVRILNIAPKFQQGMQLKPGEYKVEVRKEGVGELVRTITLKQNEDVTLDVNLPGTTGKKESAAAAEQNPDPQQEAQQMGRLFVKAVPEGSAIRLLEDGAVFKQGIKLNPGEYTIEVSRKGYQSTTLKAEVFENKDTRVSITLISDTPLPPDFPPAELEDEKIATSPAGEAKEQIYVVTKPENATVRILNIVPKFDQGLEVGHGTYEVEVSHDKYETQVRMVEVPQGKHVAVGFDLRPPEERLRKKNTPSAAQDRPLLSDAAKGQLFVETNVEDPSISLMDLNKSFEQGMELAPGTYRIEVFKKGVGRKEGVAVISPGKVSHVTVRLSQPATQERQQEREQMAEQRKTLLNRALDAERAKDFSTAMDIINQALELDPRYAKSYKIRGDIFFALRDFHQALENYDRSIELYPDTASPYLARGKTYALLKDPESACYDFWKACALERCEGIATAKKQGLCR